MKQSEYQIGTVKIVAFNDTEVDLLLDIVRKTYPDLHKIGKFNISNGIQTHYVEVDDDIELINPDIKKSVTKHDVKLEKELLSLLPYNIERVLQEPEIRRLQELRPEAIINPIDNLKYICEFAKIARRHAAFNQFSANSKRRLDTCHEAIQAVMNIASLWVDITILDGHRGQVRQNEAYQKGYSQLKYPHSKHNKIPSLAVDIAPYPIDWKDTGRFKLFIGKILMIADILLRHTEWELISGVDWDSDSFVKDHTFLDHPHFELRKR